MTNPIKKYQARPIAASTVDGLLSQAVMLYDNAEITRAVITAIIQTANICHDTVQAHIDSLAESERQALVYNRG
jgi:hypothetical protein